MRLAHVSVTGRGETDRLLAKVVALLETDGLRLAGTVQTNLARAGRDRCDMDLRVLPDGPVFRISEDRGAMARGCLLDPQAIETAAVEVAARIGGADLLVVNKFGKQEAAGRGFVPAIASAIARGMPVLVGVNGLNLPDYLTFAGGLSVALPPVAADIRDWCRESCLAG